MWPKEIIEPVVISAGLPLVLSCDPPPGPPKPETYWMSSCKCVFKTRGGDLQQATPTHYRAVAGSYARPFNWPIQTAFPTMQPVRQDRRVSMGVNGDLYFSNVLFNDSVADYCCNARLPYRNVIQQKMPVVVKVLTSGCDFVRALCVPVCVSDSLKYITIYSGILYFLSSFGGGVCPHLAIS